MALGTVLAFGVLFGEPLRLLASDWWHDPEAGHGLLLVPIALWLAWQKRCHGAVTQNMGFGVSLLLLAIVMRYASGR